MSSFRFANPEWLWLLLAVPFLFWLCGRLGKRAAIRFPSTRMVRQIAAFVRHRPGRFHASLRWLAITALIFALARPQTGEELSSTRSSGIDIILALDLSTSMWAHDFSLNGQPADRLSVVRSVIKPFISQRNADRMGLVAFAADPYVVSPLTLNHDWLLRRIDDLSLGSIPDGTAIGSAIAAAANRLRNLDAKSRIVILLTDGANNRGEVEPIPAAQAAAAFGIKVYTIGVGRTGRVDFPARFDENGQPMRDRLGRIVMRSELSTFDADTLKEVANITGARYFQATDSDSLKDIYAEIDRLERSEVQIDIRRLFSEAFVWPLSLGMFLFFIDWLLQQTRFRRLP